MGVLFRFSSITKLTPGLYPDDAMNGITAPATIAAGAFKVFYPQNNGREGLFINIQAFSILIFGIVDDPTFSANES
jgi:hypothetical protein